MGRKSAKIATRKGAADKARGQAFTRALKDVFIASKGGGPDSSTNFLLKVAVERCKKLNVPKDNIDKAIKKGQGSDGVGYEDVNYEGYGLGGVAIMVETLTDNKNRTVSEVRHIFSKHGGNLAESGAVSWMFEQKGTLEVAKGDISEDNLLMVVLDAGAEDIQDGDDVHELVCTVSSFEEVKKVLEKNEIGFGQASLSWVPKAENLLEVEVDQVGKIIRLLEGLEDLDDVQKVYSNFDLQEDALDAVVAL